MKTAILSIVLLVPLASHVQAGAQVSAKQPATFQAEPECFGPGFEFGVYGGGLIPRHSHDNYDSSMGGGMLADYFFNAYCGIQLSYGAFATSGGQHLFNGDLIVRAPIRSICVAPYLMAGGGFHVDGTTVGEYHAGAGVEVKLHKGDNMSLFADGAYYWHGSIDKQKDFTEIRLGVKFHL